MYLQPLSGIGSGKAAQHQPGKRCLPPRVNACAKSGARPFCRGLNQLMGQVVNYP